MAAEETRQTAFPRPTVDGAEMIHGRLWAADHHAVAALQAPDAAGGADIDIVDVLSASFLARRISSL